MTSRKAYDGALADVDVLVMPTGLTAGLPVSMQLVGRFFDDPLLMRVAYAYEHATDWDKIIGVRR